MVIHAGNKPSGGFFEQEVVSRPFPFLATMEMVRM